ncbi:MAG: glycosyltransferase family 2 protein [Clostridia bacterium]|nr:glycosyltransferase family 2 protein [Clostridia bacterium]
MNSISIIMINKNRGFCLRRSISSAVSQLQPCDEILLIDDDSDDDSLDIMRSFSDRATIEQCRSGGNRSLVRNRAAAHSAGDILLFLDSDVALFPGSLDIIRAAFDDPETVGASGTTFGNDHSSDQVEIAVGKTIDQLADMFDSDPSSLYAYPTLFDYRWHNPSLTADPSGNWKYYFGCFNAVRADIYRSIGGFDESFVKWGSEDIEFGYRLGKLGKIVYCRDAVVFHFSHARNIFKNTRSNAENMCYFLGKHPSLEMEIHCAFKLDANPQRLDSMRRMCAMIAKHNRCEPPVLREGEAAVMLPSEEHESGCVLYMEQGELHSYELFGFALPAENKRFSRLYICSEAHALPDRLLAMLLQECLRVSHEVLLSNEDFCCPPIYFDEPGFYNGSPILNYCTLICQFIEDFDFTDADGHYQRVTWKKNLKALLTGRE